MRPMGCCGGKFLERKGRPSHGPVEITRSGRRPIVARVSTLAQEEAIRAQYPKASISRQQLGPTTIILTITQR